MAKSGCLHSLPNSHAPSFRAVITPPRRHSRHPRHSRVGASIQRGKGNTTVPLDSPRSQSYRLSAVRLASLILTARRESRVPTYGAPRRHSRAWPLVAGGIQRNKGNRLPTAPSFSRLPRRHCPLRRAITALRAVILGTPVITAEGCDNWGVGNPEERNQPPWACTQQQIDLFSHLHFDLFFSY